MYLKPHAGQTFTLAGVEFQFLQTHEDSIAQAGNESIGGFNDTSTILKISHDGVSFLILGDINQSAERILLSHYSAETLHATVVQPAHHLYNLLNQLYSVVAPTVALAPVHAQRRWDCTEKYAALARAVPALSLIHI